MNIVPFLSALEFAAEKHKNQKRKDAEASPYINHPIAVAKILADEGGVTDESLLIAAILHDTVEDTATTPQELVARFGADVAALVGEVTDDKSLPKEKRKELQIINAPHKSARAKQLKIADKISNIRDIVSSPPADWSMARKRGYLDWTKQVVQGCRGMNELLDRLFDVTLTEAGVSLASGGDLPTVP